MSLGNKDLKQILLDQNYLSGEDIARAEKLVDTRNISLYDALTDLGLLTRGLYEHAVMEHYGLPNFNAQDVPPDPDAIALLPEEMAREFHVVVVGRKGRSVTVATSDPGNELLEEALRVNLGSEKAIMPEAAKKGKKGGRKSAFSFGRKSAEQKRFRGKIEFLYAPQSVIEALLVHYRKPLETRFQKIIEENRKVAPEILEEIFDDAIQLRASDIHFEPQEKIVIVRFRVDGVMHEAGHIPKQYYEGVLNRVKIAANMRIDEHFAAQDGAIRYQTQTGTMDVRVSIVPIVDGEKIALRLLSEYVRTLTLNDLGFSNAYKDVLTYTVHKPFGMVLTTGPTGSGKSTTLYSLMKIRNTPDVNISTIEDPVEYKVPGINHIQVNPDTELTFANGLRALVRQDPDIILVGEIRDGETASIAVNAALTGHLLFSTLHANDAATAVPRLLDMGVEPFLLASTLEVIMAQRLVRRICPECRYSYTLREGEVKGLFSGASRYFHGKVSRRLYKGKGCEGCGGTGYRGRIGIYELLVVTPEMEELIVARATSGDINVMARKQGMTMLFEDGFEKVQAGVTTIEELMRVAAPPEIVFSHYGSNSPATRGKKRT